MARSMLLYGESGTYKTANLGVIADYLCSQYGQPVRLLTADSGWGPVQDQIDRGVIIPWRLTTAKYPLACVMKACRGLWPSKWTDPENGVADESSMTLTSTAKNCSGLMMEGLTMIGSLLMYDATRKQRDTGEPLQAKFDEMGEAFAHPSRGTYGFIQTQSFAYVTELKSLPLPWVVMTSHEGKGEDFQRRLIFGPAIVGKAGTDKIPGWFENCLHFESYMMREKAGKTGEEALVPGVRAFFIRHQDPDTPNIFWPAKLGVTPPITAQIRKHWPGNFIPLLLDAQGNYKEGCSAADLMELIDSATFASRNTAAAV